MQLPPIYSFSILLKFFEKVMYNRLSHYLDTYAILTQNQFGFRKKNHSTYIAI